jgi:hypothetical protein
MHFYMHSYLHKKNYSCKKWVLHVATNLKQKRMYNLTMYHGSSFIDSINLTNGSNPN